MASRVTAEVPTFELDEDGRHVHVTHQCTRPASWPPVEGTLPIGPDGWTTVSTDPITVMPSIQCDDCGLHGFITNREWRSA